MIRIQISLSSDTLSFRLKAVCYSRKENMTLEEYRARVARDKRYAILDASVTLFLENGFAGTQVDSVAKAAGVSSATVYKHFKTKAELFGAIMERLWENEPGAEGMIPDAGNPREGMLMIGKEYADLLLEPKVVELFRVMIAEVPRFPELGIELYERGKKPYLDRLGVYFENEIEAGTLAMDDVSLAERQFLGMINDMVFWPRLLVRDLEVNEKEASYVVEQAVETMMVRYGKA